MPLLTEQEQGVMVKCALCGQSAEGGRNEHLLFKCKDQRVVAVRRRIEEMVEKEVSRLVRPGPVREAILVPWRLDSEGRPPDVGQLEEVEAIIGVVSGTGAPAADYRKLVERWKGEGFVDSKGALKEEEAECFEKRQML